MKFYTDKYAGRAATVEPEYEMVGDDKIIGSTPWADAEGDVERYQVLTTRHGKIVDMQGCRTRHEAERFARHRPA